MIISRGNRDSQENENLLEMMSARLITRSQGEEALRENQVDVLQCVCHEKIGCMRSMISENSRLRISGRNLGYQENIDLR